MGTQWCKNVIGPVKFQLVVSRNNRKQLRQTETTYRIAMALKAFMLSNLHELLSSKSALRSY